MTDINYQVIADEALAMVQEFGRDVTFRRIDQAPASAGQPWKGPTTPDANYDAEVTIAAVIVHPESAIEMGLASETSDLIKLSEQVLIVAPGKDLAEDLATFDEVLDEGRTWKIERTQTLRPGSVTLLYIFGVSE